MKLISLYLHNFRLYEEASFDFGPNFNVIHGANAQGKTSLLEAIGFLMTGRSFRGAQLSELIRHGQDSFYIEAHFIKHGIEQTLRLGCSRQERKFFFNRTLLPSTAQILGILPGVVASPDDVNLVKGAPVARRQYLDVQLAQVDPLYVHHLMRYNRALRQRNCLLRAKQEQTIESWEHEMAGAAAYIVKRRVDAVAALQVSFERVHQQLTDTNEELRIVYKTSAPSEDAQAYFLELYRKNRKREMEMGSTLHGPHREDMLITIKGQDVRSFASEGQQRTCVAGLRMAEWERLDDAVEESPLMLVDDVGIGLDSRRCDLMMNHLRGLSQVFLTTTSDIVLPDHHLHKIHCCRSTSQYFS